MQGVDPLSVLAFLALLLFSATVHEMAHAGMARYFGDPTAKEEGRLTLNPIPHIDPMMSIVVPLGILFLSGFNFIFGGAKPVPVDPTRFREGVVMKRGMMWVSLAGPVSNFIQAFIFLYLAHQLEAWYGYAFRTWFIHDLLMMGGTLNVLLGLFNLIPFPPLDGSKVLAGVLPDRAADFIYRMERFALPMIAILFVGLFLASTMLPPNTILEPIMKTVTFFSEAARKLVV